MARLLFAQKEMGIVSDVLHKIWRQAASHHNRAWNLGFNVFNTVTDELEWLEKGELDGVPEGCK